MPDSPTPEPEPDFVCDWNAWVREACAGEPLYGELKDKQYCVLHFPGKEKSADFEPALQRKLAKKDFDFRGVWFPDELPFENFEFRTKADFSNATFSAEANFSNATFSAEADFTSATFSAEADFTSVTFSGEADFVSATFSAEASFNSATFSGEADFVSATFSVEAYFVSAKFRGRASFSHATFSGSADFNRNTFSGEADFVSTTFSGAAHFNSATFGAEANFGSATFRVAYFISVTFSAEALFISATFSAEAYFRYAKFSAEADFIFATFGAEAYFRDATFAGYVRFAGAEKHHVFTDTSRLDLQFARIEKPDRVSFHTLSLRPRWFVNIEDARKFRFTNVKWGRLRINEEISRLAQSNISSPHDLLAIACRNLAVNAEENHRYEEASKFRYMAMEARRVESWRGFAPWRLDWWYWLASGYGERVLQAFLVLLSILVLFALLYTQLPSGAWETKGVTGTSSSSSQPPTRFGPALTYSAGVMTLQKPEPRPATTAAQTVVLLETILGPVQAALLALAIRRKFMR